MRKLELLAPAKNLQCGIAAINHGADAVYIGAMRFGAREAAGNSVADIAALCRYAHPFGVKVFVTVNTLVYNEELSATNQLLQQLKEARVDAVLVQDMGVAMMALENGLALHASTQTDNRTVEKVRWLRDVGFERVVLARELSLSEITTIHCEVPDIELEAFVHGALCVSFSGQCYASEYCFRRSANRGACAQFCRLKFDLKDADGRMVEQGRHLLSLRDLCQIDALEDLAEAGVTSFKIEGRLKDVAYVKNVTAAYSQRLNALVAKYPDCYCRASRGVCSYSFTPNLQKTFNRGFTHYFLYGRNAEIFSPDTPKAMGEYVGRVKEIRGKSFSVAGIAAFANGDGLCFINGEHELEGFRVNKVMGNQLFPLTMPLHLRKGMALYRNNDREFERLMARNTAVRKLPIAMTLTATESGLQLTAEGVKVAIDYEKQCAQKPQRENIVRQLSKLGDTPFVLSKTANGQAAIFLEPEDFPYFVPSSLLADMRRRLVEQLLNASVSSIEKAKVVSSSDFAIHSENPQRDLNGGNTCRLQSNVSLPQPNSYQRFPYLYNVSNLIAVEFYRRNHYETDCNAFELHHPKEALLMQCKHCLRYSLGVCERHGGKKPQWKEPLYLWLPDGRRFRLQFNCADCQMNVFAE